MSHETVRRHSLAPRRRSGASAAPDGAYEGALTAAGMAKLRALSYLVVDGEQMSRAVMVGHLRALGARDVIEAGGAGQTIALVEERPVDVLLIGERLPDMNGADLAWCLKRSGKKRLKRVRAIPFNGETLSSPRAGSELHLRIFREIYAPNFKKASAAPGVGRH